MENNKENQECTAQSVAPEKKKKGFFKKYVVPGLAIVGGIAVVYLIDDKFCGGKGRKFVAKQASNVMGKVTKPKETPKVEHHHEEPAVRETIFVAAVEAPERHQDARPFVKKTWDNGNRAADNKHNNVQRNNN